MENKKIEKIELEMERLRKNNPNIITWIILKEKKDSLIKALSGKNLEEKQIDLKEKLCKVNEDIVFLEEHSDYVKLYATYVFLVESVKRKNKRQIYDDM